MLPENAKRDFEFINERVIEAVSNNRSSNYAAIFTGELYVFLRGKDLGHITSSDGGYKIAGQRYIPDVAFISKAKLPIPTDDAYLPIPPDLAIEVLSPSNHDEDIRVKIVNYLSEGVVVWLVNPVMKQVEVYRPAEKVLILNASDTLDGAPVLPGFTLPLHTIFKE